MINFDAVGVENMRDQALRRPASEADLPSSFGDVFSANLDVVWNENIIGATSNKQQEFVLAEFERLAEVDPSIYRDPTDIPFGAYVPWYQGPIITKRIKELQAQYPDKGFVTWDQLEEETINPWFASQRETAEQKTAASPLSGLAGFAAYSTEMFDPATLPLMALGPEVGWATKGIGQAIGISGKALVKEALYAGAIETARMPFIYQQKQDINSPFGMKDAVYQILTVAGGAGIIRAGGSLTFDLVNLRKTAVKLREEGKVVEADVLDRYREMYENAPTLGDPEMHMDALQRTHDAYVEGRAISQEEIDEVFGARAEEVAPEEAAPREPVNTEIKMGAPIRLKDVEVGSAKEIELSFRSKQQTFVKTIDDLFGESDTVVVGHQKRLNQVGKKIAGDLDVSYEPPPFRSAKKQIKSRERVEQKVIDKYEGDYSLVTDIVRSSFVVERASDAEKVVARLGDQYEVLDEGLNASFGGYVDQKVLVRFEDGRIGEVQIIEKGMHKAKYEKGGHTAYVKWRTINRKENPEEWAAALNELEAIYSPVLNAWNRDWKELFDIADPSLKTSAKLTSRQESPSPGSAIENAVPSSRSNTAGIPSQEAKSVTLSQSNKVISYTSNDIIPRNDTYGIHLEDKSAKELMEAELVEAQRILDDSDGDFIIPISREDSRGQVGTDYVSANKIFEDIATEERIVNNLTLCMRGKGV